MEIKDNVVKIQNLKNAVTLQDCENAKNSFHSLKSSVLHGLLLAVCALGSILTTPIYGAMWIFALLSGVSTFICVLNVKNEIKNIKSLAKHLGLTVEELRYLSKEGKLLEICNQKQHEIENNVSFEVYKSLYMEQEPTKINAPIVETDKINDINTEL